MQYRPLGSTGLRVSAVSFGAGPVSGLMTGPPRAEQATVVRHAIEAGINWFDTAAGYGAGESERNLGLALRETGLAARVHVATKVRLASDDLFDVRGAVQRSFTASLERLQTQSVTLLQLHNSITHERGDEPTSVTPADVLGRDGVLAAFEELRRDGLVQHLGLTGIGHPEALRTVIHSSAFATVQTPYHVLNPSACRRMPPSFTETNYGNILADCAQQRMGVFAIRVYAAGALIGAEPSAHTRKTPFFPLALYERDRQRAERLAGALAGRIAMTELALRFVLSRADIASAIVGFANPSQIDEASRCVAEGPLPEDLLARLHALDFDSGALAEGRP
jgi:aryl-alcohol dehydrogenase-like predicted oxidoreductase